MSAPILFSAERFTLACNHINPDKDKLNELINMILACNHFIIKNHMDHTLISCICMNPNVSEEKLIALGKYYPEYVKNNPAINLYLMISPLNKDLVNLSESDKCSNYGKCFGKNVNDIITYLEFEDKTFSEVAAACCVLSFWDVEGREKNQYNFLKKMLPYIDNLSSSNRDHFYQIFGKATAYHLLSEFDNSHRRLFDEINKAEFIEEFKKNSFDVIEIAYDEICVKNNVSYSQKLVKFINDYGAWGHNIDKCCKIAEKLVDYRDDWVKNIFDGRFYFKHLVAKLSNMDLSDEEFDFVVSEIKRLKGKDGLLYYASGI